MPPWGASVLDGLAEDALRLGVDALELEYKDGHEEVVAIQGNVAVWDRAVPCWRSRPAVVDARMLRSGHPPDLRKTR